MRGGTSTANTCGQRGTSQSILSGSLLLSVFVGSIFYAWGSLDIETSRIFKADTKFVGSQLLSVEAIRNIFRALFIASLAVATLGIALARGRDWFWVSRRGWLYVLACLIIGPGLVANVIFKQHWGRPRPHQTIEFGGTKIFQPAWQPSSECSRNCSFVSGEAAASYSTFYALAMLIPHYRLLLFVVGTLAGLLSGLVRISQGGHFLSDVIFAGLLVAMCCTVLHMLILQPGSQRRQH